jgi:hypothetical protein
VPLTLAALTTATVYGWRLLDYLDGALGALRFACTANEAFVNFDGNRFAVFHFVDTDRAGVYAAFASVAFSFVNYNFYHYLIPLLNFIKNQKEK